MKLTNVNCTWQISLITIFDSGNCAHSIPDIGVQPGVVYNVSGPGAWTGPWPQLQTTARLISGPYPYVRHWMGIGCVWDSHHGLYQLHCSCHPSAQAQVCPLPAHDTKVELSKMGEHVNTNFYLLSFLLSTPIVKI